MKVKYEDLEKILKKLSMHSQKGDIEVSIEPTTRSLRFEYMSNVGTETSLAVGESELNRFVTVTEKKWLNT